ncbi:hypothetical protein [Variovorax sp. GT1P44]|uniref:non-homologous end-joining DNA ligase LigD n=1 Tax=Variovorax sp. GT1P44 TaxID=3443742 RepID=UPI003F47A7EB
MAKSEASNRVGKLFVDYLRNGRGATTSAAFSARARPGFGASMPVRWGELQELKKAALTGPSSPRENTCHARRQTLGRPIGRRSSH